MVVRKKYQTEPFNSYSVEQLMVIHDGLVHKLARKALATLNKARVPILPEYEDVHQTMMEGFVKAHRAFDPEFGVQFNTYLGRTCWNHFSISFSEYFKNKNGNLVVYEVGLPVEDEEGGSSYYDLYVDDIASGLDKKVFREEVKEGIASLSTDARLVLRALIDNSTTEESIGINFASMREQLKVDDWCARHSWCEIHPLLRVVKRPDKKIEQLSDEAKRMYLFIEDNKLNTTKGANNGSTLFDLAQSVGIPRVRIDETLKELLQILNA